MEVLFGNVVVLFGFREDVFFLNEFEVACFLVENVIGWCRVKDWRLGVG